MRNPEDHGGGVTVQTTTPAQFRDAHGDMTTWAAVDFDIYEHLIEAQSADRRERREKTAEKQPKQPATT